MTTFQSDACRCWNEGQWGRVHREDCPVHGPGSPQLANVGQKAGTQMEAGIGGGRALNVEARMERTNKVFAELLKDGRAEVSDLSLGDIARLAKELGWQGDPRVEFGENGVYVSAPGRKRRSASRDTGQEQPADVKLETGPS